MSNAPGRSKCRTAATLLAALAALAVLPMASAAATPSKFAATISNSLKRQTGYSASQLTTKPVCGTPKPGQMSCLAQILIVKSTGKPVSLLHTPHASPMRVTRHSSLAPAAVSADQTGTPAPQSGTAGFLQWAYDTTWLSANRGSGDTVAIIDAYDDPSAYADMETFRSANGLADPACVRRLRHDLVLRGGQPGRERLATPQAVERRERILEHRGVARPRRRLVAVPAVQDPVGRGQQ